MNEPTATNFNNPRTIFAILGCGTVALVTFLVLPLYVGLMADSFGFSESQLGTLASMDLLGIALMSLSAPLWINHWNWRTVVRWALLWIVVLNAISAALTDLWSLCLARFLAGACGGMIAVMVIKAISFTRNPDRVMAFFVVCQISTQVIGFTLLPSVTGQWGVLGFFSFLNVIALLGLALTVYFPSSGAVQDGGDGAGDELDQGEVSGKTPIRVLAGMVCFFIAQVSVFSFVERLGVEVGFAGQDIGTALTVSVIIGLAGALVGAAIALRFGRMLPILLAGIIQISCFVTLAGNTDYFLYIALMSLLQFFWNMPLGYQVGLLVSVDKQHRFVVLVPFVQAMGIASGPFLGGFALEAMGYPGLMALACAALALYLILLVPLARLEDAGESVAATVRDH